jgi:hypothetical protein
MSDSLSPDQWERVLQHLNQSNHSLMEAASVLDSGLDSEQLALDAKRLEAEVGVLEARVRRLQMQRLLAPET